MNPAQLVSNICYLFRGPRRLARFPQTADTSNRAAFPGAIGGLIGDGQCEGWWFRWWRGRRRVAKSIVNFLIVIEVEAHQLSKRE